MALWSSRRARGRRRTAAPLLMAACLLALRTPATGALPTPTHPLDPLTPGELATVREILIESGKFSPRTKFAWIELEEPPKAAVEQFHPGDDFPRKVYLTAIDFDARKSLAVRVDIKARRIVALDDLQRLQPGLTDRDIELGREIVRTDKSVAEALVKHGITLHNGLNGVRALYMGVGTDASLQAEGGRLLRVLFVTDQDAINDFGPVLDGVMAVVDLYARRVVRLYDEPGVPIVKVPHDIFDPAVRGPASHAVAPVTVSGRSFKINGHVVDWGAWRFRFGFNLREGLVLYQLSFDDHGHRRPIVYRASLSEILSRYADSTKAWASMEFFDESNFGLGYLAASLVPGRELPGNAVMLAALLPGQDQSSLSHVYRNTIYVYERDAGNLLYYQQGDRTIAARATELVIGFSVPLGNYAYGLNWVFKQDGSFAFEAELAGEILTRLTPAKTCEPCTAMAQAPGSRDPKAQPDDAVEPSGTLVHPNVLGLDHQHWFNLRLDFDVDGSANAVMENNVKPAVPKAAGDPDQGSQLTVTHTVLTRSVDAKRDADDGASRSWTIYNPSSLGPTGRPVGYSVVPGESVTTLYPPTHEPGIAAFTFHQFWVTPYRDDELFADGRYPNQPPPDYADTLYHYANEQSVFDRDVVVWYSLGETHIPRPEDYPLMPNMKLSVLFRPEGFFAHDPSLGLAHEGGR
jgi:primary-amine oxidase